MNRNFPDGEERAEHFRQGGQEKYRDREAGRGPLGRTVEDVTGWWGVRWCQSVESWILDFMLKILSFILPQGS